MLRKKGVVEKFVEFYGPGPRQPAAGRPRHHRQHGARVRRHHAASSPSTTRRLDYLRLTGRTQEHVDAGRGATARSRACSAPTPRRTRCSPTRWSWTSPRWSPSSPAPSARRTACRCSSMKTQFEKALARRSRSAGSAWPSDARRQRDPCAAAPELEHRARRGGDRGHHPLHQHLQPVGDAGRRPARQEGRRARAHVQALGEDQPRAGLAGGHRLPAARPACMPYLEALGFHLVGYGCTTCIGNSGRCPSTSPRRSPTGDLVVAAVLSGNRNFEGRINPQVQGQLPGLARRWWWPTRSPARWTSTSTTEPHRHGQGRQAGLPQGHLADRRGDRRPPSRKAITPEMFSSSTPTSSRATRLAGAQGAAAATSSSGTRSPPTSSSRRSSTDMPPEPAPLKDIRARGCWRCSATPSPPTTSRRPATSPSDSPAAKYLMEQGVEPMDFNSYGSRRGNHEVMMRGTFANIRLQEPAGPAATRAASPCTCPTGEQMSIYDAADEVPGRRARRWWCSPARSTARAPRRDWAAKGTMLLGVQRGHRRELRAHPPLEPGRHGRAAAAVPGRPERRPRWASTGTRRSTISGVSGELAPRQKLEVVAPQGRRPRRSASPSPARLDTPVELDYYKNGGILQTVLRRLASEQ